MISAISGWAEQIIIAIIIATIFEMLIPECKNKKYVKTVIGLYILFTILSPLIKNFSGSSISFADSEYMKNVNDVSNSYSKFNMATNNNIQETYKLSLKQDLQEKLNKKGYIASNIIFDIKDNGEIKKLTFNVSNKPQEEEKVNNSILINKVEIGNNEKTKESTTITDKEIKELREYLSNEYGVENIEIN